MKKQVILILLFLIVLLPHIQAIKGISVLAERTLLDHPLAQKSINDFVILLKKACQCDVKVNDRSQEILIILPSIDATVKKPSPFAKDLNYPYLYYPPHDYTWISKRIENQIQLELQCTTYEGLSNGIYGLLQEQLWFAFYHPKQTIIPKLDFWPISENFKWEAKARFDKKGFHLHTMHPLELTEPLLNPDCPQGIEQVKEYIDWLVRNQQNYFEFNLLETEDLNRWVNYIKPAIDYAHSRGVLVGLDLSLHMTQQKAFMLYKNFPVSLQKAQKQIADNLKTIFQVDWDLIAMEASTTEFTSGNVSKIQELQLFVTDLVVNKYNSKLAGRKHVVKSDKMLGKKVETAGLTDTQSELDAHRGVFIHTVMFYGLTDKKAPVYENENLLHLLDILKTEQQQRETWYYPESAYWITFDNSVPMLLLPYLQARLDDILLMDSLNVSGHLTFSSGWEWGYWMVDWSIARWSWVHRYNGQEIRPKATQFLGNLFQNQEIASHLNTLAFLQQKYIKDKELIRYLVAQTVTDEMPKPLNLEFHPRPLQSYKWLRKKANKDDISIIKKNVIEPLLEFVNLNYSILQELSTEDYELGADKKAILKELTTAFLVTNLRAKHKAHSLSYLLDKRQKELDKKYFELSEDNLSIAQQTREKALLLVEEQEQNYRYPLELIARKIKGGGQTAYDFGYLYPVHNLHFWQREEEQINKDKYGPFFKSIWDIPRILGIVD